MSVTAVGALTADGRPYRRAVAVVAHPDDESFGLGAVLSALVELGTEVAVLCFTAGEASTLGAQAGLGEVRRAELVSAADVLGITDVALHDFADGALGDVAADVLDDLVEQHMTGADLVVVFESAGVTGHPDHRAATAAAHRVAAHHALPVLEWGVRPDVAQALNEEFGTTFVGLTGTVFDVEVDRRKQRRAIACHVTQATGNAVLERRLALQGRLDRIRIRAPRR